MCGSSDDVVGVRADNPIVKVAPVYPQFGTTKPIPGCAVVKFTLAVQPGTEGKAMIPDKIEVVRATEPRFGEAAASAISKWLYLSKNVPSSNEYYTVIQFEPE